MSALHWIGNLSVTHNGLDHPTLDSFRLDGRYLHWEKQVVIDALESWLGKGDLCGNLKCPRSSAA
jgi:hypothetical protein